jgi:hypothetical protein
MANKDRLVIVGAALDKQTGKWTARITIAHTMHPAGLFDIEEKQKPLLSASQPNTSTAEPSRPATWSRRFLLRTNHRIDSRSDPFS